jgi:anti-sigma-K factor RskA
MAADEDGKVMEVLAAEYVLGTLDAAERAGAEGLVAREPAFAAMVRQWETRLGGLSESVAPVAPPDHVRGAILRRIAGDDPAASPVVTVLTRKVNVWRGMAAAATALAAVLAGLLIYKPAPPAQQGRFVAVLQPEGQGAAFVASVDLASGFVSIRRVGAELPVGKSHELWAVGGGRDKPESLGLITAGLKVPARLSADTVLAVSLEPEGGSPTGQPTGPVLFTGKLVATE